MHNFSNDENITCALLKALSHVKNLWDTYCVQHARNDFELCSIGPTWGDFVDSFKEYLHVGNYEDQCMKWTTLVQGKD
jgi:hypothetical protein